ncbi:MAG: hypothetical protein ACREGB_03595 [Candidatus Saccharimonadales bacterium]
MSFAFDEHASLLGLTGRGIGRARLWRAYQRAGKKPVDELPSHALQPTTTYAELTEAFHEVQTSEPQREPILVGMPAEQ